MCRYGTTDHKPHLACFRCRKVFRRRHARDVEHHARIEAAMQRVGIEPDAA